MERVVWPRATSLRSSAWCQDRSHPGVHRSARGCCRDRCPFRPSAFSSSICTDGVGVLVLNRSHRFLQQCLVDIATDAVARMAACGDRAQVRLRMPIAIPREPTPTHGQIVIAGTFAVGARHHHGNRGPSGAAQGEQCDSSDFTARAISGKISAQYDKAVLVVMSECGFTSARRAGGARSTGHRAPWKQGRAYQFWAPRALGTSQRRRLR